MFSQQYSPVPMEYTKSEAEVTTRFLPSPLPGISQPPPRPRTWRQKQLSGWRVGLTYCTMASVVVLIVNITVTVWAHRASTARKGFGTLFSGDCQRTKTLSTWMHLALNGLSTILLSASSYAMQICSAPTRTNVDKAHEQRKWLDIGVLSLRNLRHVGWKRVSLWTILGLSSVLLHLVYNSAVSRSVSEYDYIAALVTNDFVAGAPFELPNGASGGRDGLSVPVLPALQNLQQSINEFERLENADCIRTYGADSRTGWGTVFVVTSEGDGTAKNLLGWAGGENEGAATWIYNYYQHYQNNVDDLIANATNWRPFTRSGANPKADYCLGQRREEKCTIELSIDIMIAVCIMNFLKAICMFAVYSQASPLVTVGDAVSSFLKKPDSSTRGFCLLSARNVKLGAWNVYAQPRNFIPMRNRWWQAASLRRWIICVSLITITLVTAGGLLGMGLQKQVYDNQVHRDSLATLWRIGWGGDSTVYTISNDNQGNNRPLLVLFVFLANTPQLLLSFLYFLYNGLLTCMLLCNEWSGYARLRKGLRVTSPSGAQRSTYFLQLPYTYAIPLVVTSTLLHWLTSQAFYLVPQIITYDPIGGINFARTSPSIGYSPIAIIFAIVVGGIMLLALIAIGVFRRYESGMPLAGSCSAAISAGCHHPPTDQDVAALTVKWGVVVDAGAGPVGHCCFTCYGVGEPVPGHVYAGNDMHERGK